MKKNLWLLLLWAGLAVACGDSKESEPPSTDLPDAGGNNATNNQGEPDAEQDAEQDAEADAEQDAEADAEQDAEADAQEDVPDGDVPEEDCEGEGGCYACRPTTQAQFLNACTDVTSVRFDNAARLPLLNADGSLPPLP